MQLAKISALRLSLATKLRQGLAQFLEDDSVLKAFMRRAL
jgi:hypothetical protein